MARVTFTELLRAEIGRRTPDHPVYELARKTGGRNFVQTYGERIPRLVYHRPFDPWRGAPKHLEWPAEPPDWQAFVVKPVDAFTCRGCVCLERTAEGLRSLWDDGTKSWPEWRTWLHEQRRKAKDTVGEFKGPWISEELICRLGRNLRGQLRGSYDWKCYVFGTAAAWVHQIEKFGRRVQAARSKHWQVGDGLLAPAPRPIIVQQREPGQDLAPPSNARALLELAGRLGGLHQEATGAPFVRVDLFETEDGEPVFGEFTPQPSGGNEVYAPEWDERLGALWLEVAGR